MARGYKPKTVAKAKAMVAAGIKLGRAEISEEILLRMFKAGYTRGQAAKELGVCVRTIDNWVARYGLDLKHIQAFVDNRADLIAIKSRACLAAITQPKIDAASLRDTAVAFNVLNNAERLERGQSTGNINVQLLTGEIGELERVERELLSELAKLRGEVVPEPEPLNVEAAGTPEEALAAVDKATGEG